MLNPIWTKVYLLSTKKGNCHIIVSEYEGSCFWASSFYIKGDRMLKASDQSGHIDFYHEKKFGETEKEAFDQVEKWASDEFGNDIKITYKKNKFHLTVISVKI